MDWDDPVQMGAFFDLHNDNPREGPGNHASSVAALSIVQLFQQPTKVLDLACGPGAGTADLLELLPDAQVTAVDLNPPFIEEVQRRVAALGAQHRAQALVGDMLAPPVAERDFDLIWCEGAAYFVGVQNALETWRDYLRDKGTVAFSECVNFSENPPQAVVDNWGPDAANISTVASVVPIIESAGYQVLGQFVLPPSAWWAYYEPLQQRVNLLREKYAEQPAALAIIEEGQSEIDVYREYGEHYGYAFYVAQKL